MKENNQTTADMSGLVDIRDVKVDRSLPVEDRIRSYVEQVKDCLLYTSDAADE